MSTKQDRPGARTATDIERKYNFGQAVTAAYVQSTVKNAVAVATNEFKGYVDGINKDFADQGEAISDLEQADVAINTELSALRQADADTQQAISGIEDSVSGVQDDIKDINDLLASPGNLLWDDDVYLMTAAQTVTLLETVSAQRHGIVLVFSEYADGSALDAAFHCFFVPKAQVAKHPGSEYTFTLATSMFAHVGTKRVLIYDTKIEGHADNDQTGTSGSGVTFTNGRFALRYVFGI